MTPDEAQEEVIAHRLQLADESLASARDDLAAGRLHRAVSSAYYACFYAAGAVFQSMGIDPGKHTHVLAAIHRDLVHAGRLEPEWGMFYSKLMEDRHRGDYADLVEFDADATAEQVAGAEAFVKRLRQLLPSA